jgi:hypothetical protein
MAAKNHSSIKKTVMTRSHKGSVIKKLLEDGWFKNKHVDDGFFKKRKNYIIAIEGANHPLWNVDIESISEQFDEQDWKLLKDLESLKHLGSVRNRKLYINQKNKIEISRMLKEMFRTGSNLIYSDSYVILRQGKKFRIFKTAAALDLVAKQDGLYSGSRRIL